MSSENSLSRTDEMAARLALLQAASAGQLDGLCCPQCRRASVSVWFTCRSDNDYWTWFLCADCGFEMRAQGDRPAHYSRQRELSSRAVAKPPDRVKT
jgi:predicted RNA-binding Zn-ribbon protein involved in translation (DUF1610 family)